MTVTEGRRTRVRQRSLRAAYELYASGRGPFAPLAAELYFSRHDEETHGNAADLAGPDGSSINLAEQRAIREHGPAFGVAYTGPTFGEIWHVEADMSYFPKPASKPNTSNPQAPAIAAARELEAARVLRLKKELNTMSYLLFSNKTKVWYEIFEFSYDKITDHDTARRIVVARNGIPSVHLAGSTVRAALDRCIARRKALISAIAGKVTDSVLEQMEREAAEEPTGPDITDADDSADV